MPLEATAQTAPVPRCTPVPPCSTKDNPTLHPNGELRRARPIVEATLGRYFEFRLMPDLGGTSQTIFDACWDGKFVPQFSAQPVREFVTKHPLTRGDFHHENVLRRELSTTR